MFNQEFLEICKFVWSSRIFFPLFSRMWLSFGAAKSQNEFVAPELVEAKLRVMMAENFGKSKFSWKVEAPGRFRA